MISNTNKPHSLAGSAYNDRRAECAEALDDLRTLMPELPSLCALTPVQFETMSAVIKNEKARRRAEHAVYEEDRAVSACEALRNGDLAEFGKLMYGSHLSLKDLFEVSCMELDTLVDLAMRHPGVLGSRMTGGGFGGCTITLIRENETASFIEKTGAAYKEKTGLTASFYVAEPGDGVHLLA